MRAVFPRPAALVALAAGLSLTAQAGTVVVVRSSELPPYRAVEDAFAAALDQPTVSATVSDEPSLRAALAQSPSLVFAIGAEAARAVLQAKVSAPKVYALVPSPARVGLDGTPGVSMFASPARQMKAVRALLPSAKTVGVLYDPSLSGQLVAELDAAATGEGLKLLARPIATQKEIAPAARELLGKVDALVLVPDRTVISAASFKFLAQTSLEMKVPLVGFSEGMSRAGAVLSVEAPYEEMGRLAASVAKKLLVGSPAGRELPDGAIYLNARSAQLLGIPVPAGLRAQAAKVFE